MYARRSSGRAVGDARKGATLKKMTAVCGRMAICDRRRDEWRCDTIRWPNDANGICVKSVNKSVAKVNAKWCEVATSKRSSAGHVCEQIIAVAGQAGSQLSSGQVKRVAP